MHKTSNTKLRYSATAIFLTHKSNEIILIFFLCKLRNTPQSHGSVTRVSFLILHRVTSNLHDLLPVLSLIIIYSFATVQVVMYCQSLFSTTSKSPVKLTRALLYITLQGMSWCLQTILNGLFKKMIFSIKCSM